MPEESETLPLLNDSIGTSDAALTHFPPPSSSTTPPPYPHLKKVILMIASIIVVADLSDFIRIAPRLRLFEASICHDYYLKHDPSVIGGDGRVPEMLCKGEGVQAEVAMLNGWLGVAFSLPGE
jgi:hypothetical protein